MDDGANEFDAIYGSEFSYVWNVLRRLGVQPKDLEDVVHDVFVAVYRHLPDYDRARPIRPWITGIAYRVAANHRRKAPYHREMVGQDVPDIQDERPLQDAVAQDRQALALVHSAMEVLDENRRTVFVLHDLEGHSIPDIAVILQVPINTLYTRLRLARSQFTDALRRLFHAGAA